jgi:hypothetical protein
VEIQVLDWNMHKHLARLSKLMGSLPSPLDNVYDVLTTHSLFRLSTRMGNKC